MDLDALIASYGKIGFSGLLIIAVLAFFREWIIPGTTAIKQLAECNERYAKVIADRDAQYAKVIADRDIQITKLAAERDENRQWLIRMITVAEQTQKVRGGGFVGSMGSIVNGERKESA